MQALPGQMPLVVVGPRSSSTSNIDNSNRSPNEGRSSKMERWAKANT